MGLLTLVLSDDVVVFIVHYLLLEVLSEDDAPALVLAVSRVDDLKLILDLYNKLQVQ